MKCNQSNYFDWHTGLFHRSILIAGSSLAPWALVSDPAAAASSLAQALNCSAPSSNSSLGLNGTSAGLFPFNLTMPVTGFQGPRLDPQQLPPHQGKSYGPHNQDPLMECLKTKHFSHFALFAPNKFAVDFGPTVDGVVIRPYFRVWDKIIHFRFSKDYNYSGVIPYMSGITLYLGLTILLDSRVPRTEQLMTKTGANSKYWEAKV